MPPGHLGFFKGTVHPAFQNPPCSLARKERALAVPGPKGDLGVEAAEDEKVD